MRDVVTIDGKGWCVSEVGGSEMGVSELGVSEMGEVRWGKCDG